MEKPALWSRGLVVLMGVNFCSALSFYLIMVEITAFAIDTYSLPASVAGLTITAYVISALLTRMFFGGAIDAWGVKRALVLGCAVNVAATALYLAPLGFAALMAVRVVHGFAFAIMSGSAAAGAALVIPRQRYGEGIGYFSMMQALATGVGPFVAISLTNAFGGYTPMFACAAVVALLALLSMPLLKVPVSQGASASSGTPPARPQAGTAERGLGRFLQLSVLPLASVLFIAYLCYAGILSFVTAYAGERGLADAVSLYFVVYAAVILVSRPLVGRRVDRLGENSTIYVCFAALAAGLVVLSLAHDAPALLVSAALVGFGIGATQSIVQAVIARDTPAGELGKANSTFFMSMDLGSGIGPVVIGAVIGVAGYSASYLLLAAAGLLAGIDYHLVHGRKKAARPRT